LLNKPIKLAAALLIITLLLSACKPAALPQDSAPQEPPSLGIEQALTLAKEAHTLASDILGEAFLLEVEGKEKPPWAEIRPLLNQYWSDDILDNSFEEFYAEHLWDWGYEICLIFPLQYEEAIISYDLISRGADYAVIKFLLAVYEDEPEKLEVKFIFKNGAWLLN
jgi:hypothetical protein